MIEILFNHREGVSKGYTLVDKLTIGKGTPRCGQLDFISLCTEGWYKDRVVWATFKWGFGWRRLKGYFYRIINH